MPLPANLYAVPEMPAPKRKPIAVELKRSSDEQHQRDQRRKKKIEQANRVLDALEARSLGLAAQIKALQRRKQAADARYEKIEDRILHEMTQAKLEKAAGLRVTFTARPCPASLVVDDEAAIPETYLREKLVSTVDKVAIKVALAKGEDVPGCHLQVALSLVRK